MEDLTSCCIGKTTRYRSHFSAEQGVICKKMNHIKSNELKATDLPALNAKWEKIIKFASTFDLQNEYKAIRKESAISSVFDVDASNNIVELRCALHSEWRRYNHVGDFITEGTLERAQELIEFLREKL